MDSPGVGISEQRAPRLAVINRSAQAGKIRFIGESVRFFSELGKR